MMDAETESLRLLAWSDSLSNDQRDRIEAAHRLLREGGTVFDAIALKRGENQQRIASEGLAFTDLLLRKNSDYGSSVWEPPVLAPQLDCGVAILVRMGDKVKRIVSLIEKEPEVTESLEDTIRDLGAYCLLWLARPRKDA